MLSTCEATWESTTAQHGSQQMTQRGAQQRRQRVTQSDGVYGSRDPNLDWPSFPGPLLLTFAAGGAVTA